MFGSIIGSVLGAATNLFGMNQQAEAAEDARNFNAMQAQEANNTSREQWAVNRADQRDYFNQNLAFQRETNAANEALQREFAKSGIRWKVEDARAAGIHPLFAVGAGGASFSPSSVVGASPSSGSYDPVRAHDPGPRDGGGWRALGQDLSRAAEAAMTRNDRVTQRLQELQLTRGELENQILAADLAKKTNQLGPPMPGADPFGSGLGSWDILPPEISSSMPGKPAQTAGVAKPSVQWADVGDGVVAMPPKDLGVEDEFGAPLMFEWWARNRISPYLGSKQGRAVY